MWVRTPRSKVADAGAELTLVAVIVIGHDAVRAVDDGVAVAGAHLVEVSDTRGVHGDDETIGVEDGRALAADKGVRVGEDLDAAAGGSAVDGPDATAVVVLARETERVTDGVGLQQRAGNRARE